MFNDLLAMGAGGEGSVEWHTDVTFSNNNKTVTLNWNYDADSVVILLSINGDAYKYTFVVDTSDTSHSWYAGTSANWQQFDFSTSMTITKRSLVFTQPSVISKVSFLPIANYPINYFGN